MSAVDMLIALLSLIPLGLIAVLLLFAEYLDWHSRLEIMERRHPKLTRLINDRPFRLVLLCMIFAMLGLDLKQTLKQPVVEPPKFIFQSGGMAEKDAEIVKLHAQLEAQAPAEPNNSLRRRTTKLVNDLLVFWSPRPMPTQQPISNPSTDEERQRNARWDKYWRDATIAYQSAGFRGRVLGVVREYVTKGIASEQMGLMYEQPNRMAGSYGSTLDNCFWYMNDLCQLQELAYHVDANDQAIIFTAK